MRRGVDGTSRGQGGSSPDPSRRGFSAVPPALPCPALRPSPVIRHGPAPHPSLQGHGGPAAPQLSGQVGAGAPTTAAPARLPAAGGVSCGPVAVPWPLQPRACAPAWRRCVPLVPNGATIPLQNTTSAMLPANQYPCQDPNGDEREGRLAFPSGGLAALGLQLGLDQGWPRRAREPGAHPAAACMHATRAAPPPQATPRSASTSRSMPAGTSSGCGTGATPCPPAASPLARHAGRERPCCLSGLALLMPL